MDFKEKELQRKKSVVGKLVGKTDTKLEKMDSPTKKRRGCPKLNREKKDRFSYTLYPSTVNDAQTIA